MHPGQSMRLPMQRRRHTLPTPPSPLDGTHIKSGPQAVSETQLSPSARFPGDEQVVNPAALAGRHSLPAGHADGS